MIDEALQQYKEALKRYESATSMRDRRLDQVTDAAADMDAADASTIGYDLIEQIYSNNLTECHNAQNEVDRAGTRLQFAHDWLQALQAGDE